MVERETKTKTFSKEGLSMAAKMDPAEKAKMEVRDWINSCTERLNMQIDQFEAEIEQLNGKRKKKTDRVLEGTLSWLYYCTSVDGAKSELPFPIRPQIVFGGIHREPPRA